MAAPAAVRLRGRGRQPVEVEVGRDVREEFTAHLAESETFVRFVRSRVDLIVDAALAGSRTAVINHAQGLGLEAERRLAQLEVLT